MLTAIIVGAVCFVVALGIYHVWVRKHPTWIAGVEALEARAQGKIDSFKTRSNPPQS